MPSRTRSMVSTAHRVSGAGLRSWGLRALRAQRTGLTRPRASSRWGVRRILSGAREMMRPMVETDGRAIPCLAHQGASKTWSFSLPRLGVPLRLHRDGARALDLWEFRHSRCACAESNPASLVVFCLPRGTCGAAVVRNRCCVTIAPPVRDCRVARRAALRVPPRASRTVGVLIAAFL